MATTIYSGVTKNTYDGITTYTENPTIVSVTRINFGGNPDETGGYVQAVWTYPEGTEVTGYSLTVGSLTSSTGTHDTENRTITAIVGDGTNVLPLTSYDISCSITTSVGTATTTTTLNASSTYSLPVVSIRDVKRCALIDGSYIEDELGTYLRAIVDYSITTTETQEKPESFNYTFSTIGPSSESIDASELSDNGTLTLISNQFGYDVISPVANIADALVISITDKMYTTSASEYLISTEYNVPKIEDFSVVRGDSTGAESDDGVYALATLSWGWYLSTYNKLGFLIRLNAYNAEGTKVATKEIPYSNQMNRTYVYKTETYSIGPDDGVISDWGGFSTDAKYTVEAVIGDQFSENPNNWGWSSNQLRRFSTLSTAFFVIDVNAKGHGISFGAPSAEDFHNVSMPHMHYKQPDLPVLTFSSLAVARETVTDSMVPCIVLTLDDCSTYYFYEY